jgi:hypothetical protein
MSGSLGQTTYTSSNSSLEALASWCRHVSRHIAAKAIMWGAVGDIGMRWKSFGSDDYLADSGSKCKHLVCQEGFKGIDAKIMVCAFPVRRDSEDLVRYED